jgi:hypothetical protein
MLETYQGVLHGDRIEWSGEAPAITEGKAVRVHVTLLERPNGQSSGSEQGRRMAAALESLSACPSMPSIADPANWERQERIDRSLPGREA